MSLRLAEKRGLIVWSLRLAEKRGLIVLSLRLAEKRGLIRSRQNRRLDTRQKIVPIGELPALLADGRWRAVAGFFDPLTLVQAERLAAFAGDDRKLLAIVESDTGSESLLAADARAALVASLRCVDAVVIASAGEVRSFGFDIDEDVSAERQRSAEFVHFVLRR